MTQVLPGIHTHIRREARRGTANPTATATVSERELAVMSSKQAAQLELVELIALELRRDGGCCGTPRPSSSHVWPPDCDIRPSDGDQSMPSTRIAVSSRSFLESRLASIGSRR